MMKKILMLLLVCLGLLSIWSCSRRDPIVENPSLKNYKVMAFVLDECPENMDGFLDSIGDLDSINVRDTAEYTINDSVALVGVFNGNIKRVQFYRWVIGEDTVITTENYTCNKIAFDSVTVVRPYFKVSDLNGYRSDSLTYISIINTKPYWIKELDTVWASKSRDANFIVVANDTAGRVDSLKFDYTGDGEFDTTVVYSDSLEFSFPYDSTKVDTLFNQIIKVGIFDDDGNTTIDSIVIHFNSPPEVTLKFPFDEGQQSLATPFDFVWSTVDEDNLDSVLYTLYASNKDDFSYYNDSNVMEHNFFGTKWEAISINDVDSIINNLPENMVNSFIYWTVLAHDGYDSTVVSDNFSFFLGDIDINSGNLQGVVQKEGLTNHAGIRVVIRSTDSAYVYATITDVEGNYSFNGIELGSYIATVSDTTKHGWKPVASEKFEVKIGMVELEPLYLVDNSKPSAFTRTFYNELITELYPRELSFEGYFLDSGSQVNPTFTKFTLNGEEIDSLEINSSSPYIWSVKLANLDDGEYRLVLNYQDNVGNKGDSLVMPFGIKCKTINLQTNSKPTDIVGLNESLTFTANVTNAQPTIKEYIWIIYNGDLGDAANFVFADTTTTDGFVWQSSGVIESGKIVVIASDGGSIGGNATISDTANFAVAENGISVLFDNPASDTTSISLGDQIDFVVTSTVFIDDVNEGSATSYDWDFDGDGTFEITDGGATQNHIFDETTGIKKVSVKANYSGLVSAITAVYVRVSAGIPVVNIKDTYKNQVVKINSPIDLGATGKDTSGTIIKWEWKCGDGAWVEVSSSGGMLKDTIMTAPAIADPSMLCKIRVTDDRVPVGNTAEDSMIVVVLQDLPSVIASSSELTVGIKDEMSLSSVANDVMGSIVDISWKCGEGAWLSAPGGTAIISAPNYAIDNYKCVVMAVDDDNQQVFDTTIVKVEERPPQVSTLKDSVIVGLSEEFVLEMVAQDKIKPGVIVSTSWSCGLPDEVGVDWTEGSGTYGADTISTPSFSVSEFNYWCIARAEDDDGLFAYDTLHLDVGSFPPTINSTSVPDSININGTINMSVNATDARGGTIIGYSWNCNGEDWSTVSESNVFATTAPSDTTSTFNCLVRVTDNDDQTVEAQTGDVKVVYDFPKVSITVDGEKEVDATADGAKEIIAEATDDVFEGSIEKYEWSCGGSGVAGSGGTWEVGTSEYTARMPSDPTVGYDYLCVVKVTDNDGMVARDTVKFRLESSDFVISIDPKAVFLNEGGYVQFVVNTNNDSSVTEYLWACSENNDPDNWEWQKYGTTLIGENHYYHTDSSEVSSNDSVNVYYCGARVTDNNSVTMTDVATITIYHGPSAEITAPGSLFVWSGNPAHHTQTFLRPYKNFSYYVNGSNSVAGTWGDHSVNVLDWRIAWGQSLDEVTFNEGRRYYDSFELQDVDFFNRDSTLRDNDDFIKAFIKLDIYDTSDVQNLDADALARHVAVDYDSIYFYRAWEKMGEAPVSATNTGTADYIDMATNGTQPFIAYSIDDNLYVSKLVGNSWAEAGSFSIQAGSKFSLVGNGTTMYVAYTTTGGATAVFSSDGGSWSKVGSDISGKSDPIIKIGYGDNLYVFAEGTTYEYQNDSWQAGINGTAFTLTYNFVVGDMTISPNGRYLAIAAQRTNDNGEVRVRLYDLVNKSTNSTKTVFEKNSKLVSVTVDDDGNYYVATIEDYELKASRCTKYHSCNTLMSSDNYPLPFSSAASAIDLELHGSNLVVSFIESQMKIVGGFLTLLDVTSVWTISTSGGDWELFGEDHLPWFQKPYHDGNYVSSYNAKLAVSSDDRVFVGFTISEVKVSGGPTSIYNGAMVMRHRASGQ